MHNFEVHSNESACRKSVRLGLDQVQPNYNSNRQYKYQCVGNQVMFAHSGENGNDEGETKEYKEIS